ncbi:hypothetical protein [Litoribrevibacter albus]|uniref:Sn-glycerol-3-phosphate transporter n=1 Tax=Litoribrevibacter albus TaxID=1473156 RepID=A0AA37SDY8_9GAMM|nr:hypothetical protein [Litoribrevibacter albus]GLQ32432.1 hypothetical protein GCM10007876_29110 [Litoribrevibacter albus]
MITKHVKVLILILCTWVQPSFSEEWLEEGDKFSFQTSVYTKHWNPKPEHNNNQKLFSIELNKKNRWLVGFAAFKNSFDQNTQYLYAGYTWALPETQDIGYFKLTAGPMHGYKGKYKDKIPLNQAGIAPAVLPSFGVSYQQFKSELVVFGAAGAMLTMGFEFPPM